jgi:hypothetical protein
MRIAHVVWWIGALLGGTCLCTGASAHSYEARAEFMRSHPCPANGQTRGACPGYVVDHVVPLCAGGADASSNMQWQAIDAAKAKDRDAMSQCRRMHADPTAGA